MTLPNIRRQVFPLIVLLFLLFNSGQTARAYSVLTHQAIIDVAWQDALVPVLKKKYPGATEEDLRRAHAHAYGGAIIQDMGYYPLGSKFFTDLTHYVRTGDFVLNLLREAANLEEYAFALGALAHYYSDTRGHAMATNRAVPLVYPELKAKYGNEVTYEEDPLAHAKVEFGFDVLQVARGNYAPESYHEFIGFEVSKEVLERAFQRTYGLPLQEQFISVDLAIGTYRRSVSTLIPGLTRAAWNMKKDDILKSRPGITRDKFQYRLRRADYIKAYGKTYQQPNLWQRFVSWLLRVLPGIGPNRQLNFKAPTPEVEKLFMQSFTATVDAYTAGIKAEGRESLTLPNNDFDTGRRTEPGDYKKADAAYAELLQKLVKSEFKGLTPDLKRNILQYYEGYRPTATAQEDVKQWQETQKALAALRSASPVR